MHARLRRALIQAATAAALLDVAVVLTDQERSWAVQAIGAALLSQPAMSPGLTVLLDKLNTAPAVVRPPPSPPEPSKEENKP